MLYSLRGTSIPVILLALACSKSGDGGTGAKSPNPPPTGTGTPGLPTVPGTPDDSVDTALPPLPRLPGLTGTVTGDRVSISVEPVEGARDYRVYVLPADGDVSSSSDGTVTVRNAIYRCAGDRQTPSVVQDAENMNQSEAIRTIVEEEVAYYRRTLPEATLGHVWVTPGQGRVPVYALGDGSESGDNSCYHQRWRESRSKIYTTSESRRSELLRSRWRDDGIVFYVPAPGAAGTKSLNQGRGENPQLYWVDGPEANERGNGEVAMSLLTDAVAGETQPLMRVHYWNGCGNSHDELVAGGARFDRARYQGDERPMFDLHWSGITGETTLVVEALADGCPFIDVLAPISRAASTDDNIEYPAYVTIEEARAASSTGEVYINGHHAATNRPRPIARSFLKVSPGPKPDMDWFAGFGPDENVPDFMKIGFNEPCNNPDNPGCNLEPRQVTDFADITFYSGTLNRNGIAVVLGELWVTYADWQADVGGKIRITPNTRATMSADSYLHVTMEVDAFSTTRRYPQILVSDGELPVQGHLKTSNTVIIQTFSDTGTANWPYAFQIEVCDNRNWEVNDQCPATDLYRLSGANGNGLAPVAEVGERTGVDLPTQFDAYLSTRRAYIFLAGQPYGCIDLPDSGIPSGSVSVTFGDVLYHSGVDGVFTFHENHQKQFAKRHFDNLGFKSGVQGPAWDEARFPCFPPGNLEQR
jgi:hypothetical protein